MKNANKLSGQPNISKINRQKYVHGERNSFPGQSPWLSVVHRLLGEWAESVSTVLVQRLSGRMLTGSWYFRMTNCLMLQAVVFTLERTLLLFYLHKAADLLRDEKAERAFFASRICLCVLADFLL